jgi:hypothetical protein
MLYTDAWNNVLLYMETLRVICEYPPGPASISAQAYFDRLNRDLSVPSPSLSPFGSIYKSLSVFCNIGTINQYIGQTFIRDILKISQDRAVFQGYHTPYFLSSCYLKPLVPCILHFLTCQIYCRGTRKRQNAIGVHLFSDRGNTSGTGSDWNGFWGTRGSLGLNCLSD